MPPLIILLSCTFVDKIRVAVEGIEAGSSSAEAFAVGTFTVVNLGMYGVKSAAPIVTMPQVVAVVLV